MPDGKVAFRHLAHFTINFSEEDKPYRLLCRLIECKSNSDMGFIECEPTMGLDEVAIKAQQHLREHHGFA